MGEYFRVVNLDKREYINPHDCGDQYGAKLGEVAFSSGGAMTALAVLISTASWENGFGRWAGDRIVLAGDYSDLQDPWENEDDWNNITADIMAAVRNAWGE